MVTFLLIVIVCLLINRKLGLVVLVVPIIGYALFLLWALWPVLWPPTSALTSATYEECVAHFGRHACEATDLTLRDWAVLLVGVGVVMALLGRRRLSRAMRRGLRWYRVRREVRSARQSS